MANFEYNDGGRSEYYKGEARDCGARAMAIALGLDYKVAYKELAQANKECGYDKSARNGLMKEVLSKVLKRHGWTWNPSPKFEGRKAYCDDMPDGMVIARMARHFVAVSWRTPNDTFDCSEKMVYGYWAKT